MQNKCIRFCLKLDKMHHISEEDFKTINWLPVDQSSRNNYARLKVPFRKTNMGQKSLSYIRASVWNKLPNSMKRNIS